MSLDAGVERWRRAPRLKTAKQRRMIVQVNALKAMVVKVSLTPGKV
jgi:hypothetical protein